MPELKPGTIWPTPEEDSAILEGIAKGPDTWELTEKDFARAPQPPRFFPIS